MDDTPPGQFHVCTQKHREPCVILSFDFKTFFPFRSPPFTSIAENKQTNKNDIVQILRLNKNISKYII